MLAVRQAQSQEHTYALTHSLLQPQEQQELTVTSQTRKLKVRG